METSSRQNFSLKFKNLGIESPRENSSLLNYIANLDLNSSTYKKLNSELRHFDLTSILANPFSAPDLGNISSANVLELDERLKLQDEKEKGIKAFQNNEVAIVIVAGGQGTRLFSKNPNDLRANNPKGCYYLDELGKSIFQIHAENILATNKKYNVELPLIITTSDHTDRKTRKYFEDNNYFGLNPQKIHFVKQDNNPVISEDNKLLLASPDSLLFSPNGHGGSIKALAESGLLQVLKAQGTKFLIYLQVDNINSIVDDPISIGYFHDINLDIVAKVLKKTNPHDKVGHLVKYQGKHIMVEYTDLKTDQMEQRTSNGDLVLKDANSGSLIINIDFLANYDFKKLPAHFSKGKSVTIWNPSTNQYEQTKATKLEFFAFDIFMDTEKSGGIRITEEEFAPIKDSTEDAVRLYRQYKIGH